MTLGLALYSLPTGQLAFISCPFAQLSNMYSDDMTPVIGMIIIGVAVAVALFWVYAVPPIVAWWKVNWYWVVIGFVITVGLGGFGFYKRSIGSASSSTYNNTSSSYSSDPVITHRYIAEEPDDSPSLTLLNSVIKEINDFRPFSWYKFERQYQIDLARHLKKSFSQVQLEQQIGSSRPDIVVEKIAIEIKGPTISRALQTISDEIL
ncbi:MAG: hypothetical protein C4291_15255 [Candidatus Dadabacteria bacterium]